MRLCVLVRDLFDVRSRMLPGELASPMTNVATSGLPVLKDVVANTTTEDHRIRRLDQRGGIGVFVELWMCSGLDVRCVQFDPIGLSSLPSGAARW